MDLNDALVIDGSVDASEEDYYSALQSTINAGQWSMQGSTGRAMMRAIKEGRCMLGVNRARDYYGNSIPARSDVQPGTKGSREFVVEHFGEEWAAHLESL